MNVVVDTSISSTPKTKLLPISPYDDLGETSPREECSVLGVRAPDEDVSKLTYYDLFALQRRGQEAAGIAVSDGDRILVFKDLGPVSQVFDEQTLDALKGHVTVEHTYYTIAGASAWENAQPMFQMAFGGADIALGHSGNLASHLTLFHEAVEKGLMRDEGELPSDSTIMTTLLADETDKIDHPEDYDCNTNVETAMMALLPRLKGAFCLTFTDGETLCTARGPYDMRPLCLGRLFDSWIVASETCALDIVGTSFIREIEPGKMVTINASGVRSQHSAETTHARCIFEYVYLAHLDSNIRDHSVNAIRLELGRQLAREFPVNGDLVIPIPGSGTPAVVGYAQESGIPFDRGLARNGYVGRTSIQPSQMIRQSGIRLKLNPLKEIIINKRLVVIDDSIVRGNAQRTLTRMLCEAGAKEVHVYIAAPPVRWPCFYGIDFASPDELLANGVDESDIVASIATAIGVGSPGFVFIDSMVAASEQAKAEICCACFDGEYLLGLPEGNLNTAAVERMQAAQAVKVATSS